MVPDACAVSGRPSDAHRHILPRVGTLAPAPPTARVSPDVRTGVPPVYMPSYGWGCGGKGGETNEGLVCPCGGSGFEGQGETRDF